MSASPQMVLPSAGLPPAAPADFRSATAPGSRTKTGSASSFRSEMQSCFVDGDADPQQGSSGLETSGDPRATSELHPPTVPASKILGRPAAEKRDAKDTQDAPRAKKENDSNALAVAPISLADRRPSTLPLHFALPHFVSDPQGADEKGKAASTDSAAEGQRTTSPAEALPAPLSELHQTTEALLPQVSVLAMPALAEEQPVSPEAVKDAAENSDLKAPSMTLAFAAKLGVDKTGDGRVPNSKAVPTGNAGSEPRIDQSGALQRPPDGFTAARPGNIAPGNHVASESGIVPDNGNAARSDSEGTRAQISEPPPQKHAAIAAVEKDSAAGESKDQAVTPSVRLTTADPLGAHVESRAEVSPPPPKSSTPAPGNSYLQSEHGLDTAPPAPPSSSHDFRVQIPDDRGRATEVRFLEAGGEVRVAVRTSDSELAQTMRSGLNELTSRLTSEGIQTEVWRPGSNTSFQQNGSSHQTLNPNDSGSGGNGSGGRRRDDSQQDKPRWLQEMEASNGAPRP